MINLVENGYALRILWGYVKCLNYKYNFIKKLVPICLVILLVILFMPKSLILESKITYRELNSYTTVLSREEKVKIILDKYNLSNEQFKVLCAIVLSEAETNSYDDAYAVINTIYNRTHSKNWVKSISNRYGNNLGENLYYQAIAPNQFVVYQHGSYKRNLGNTESIGYDAIIEFLYTEEVMHNYLSFRSHSIKIRNSEAFSSKGNNYFNVLKEENKI